MIHLHCPIKIGNLDSKRGKAVYYDKYYGHKVLQIVKKCYDFGVRHIFSVLLATQLPANGVLNGVLLWAGKTLVYSLACY